MITVDTDLTLSKALVLCKQRLAKESI